MVMGEDSCSRGSRFESQQPILDGHFFTLIFVKIILFVLKDQDCPQKENICAFTKLNVS